MGIIFISLISLIITRTYVRRELVRKSRFPICHDIIEEFSFCPRCRGFQIGLFLFGVFLAIKNTVYLDLLRMMGVYPYTVLLFIAIVSVPIHGALRRLQIITSENLLHVIGFLFSSTIYLSGNLIVYLVYG
jgi:hypothetical protein